MPERKGQDDELISEQWQRHHRPLLRYLRWRLGARAQEAEDLLQEVFKNLVQYSRAFRDARDPKAYLYRVAENVLNRHSRGPQHEPLPDLDSLEGQSVDTIDQLIDADELQFVLDGLPSEERAIIYLRYVDGQLPQEIAEATGLSKDQVERRLKKARHRLKGFRNERKTKEG